MVTARMTALHGNVQGAISGLAPRYKVHDHEKLPSRIKTPQDFAAALGYPLQRITKTLFLRSHDGGMHAVAVCSIDRRLDLKSIAGATGARRLEVAPLELLEEKTGYSRNGVSPLGLAPDISVVMDAQLFDYPTVLVGGGAAGIEIELSPADLSLLSRAMVENITVGTGS
jgi:Cys-tRNA(Pro)/Cys-tRNA(Cys) deacylase